MFEASTEFLILFIIISVILILALAVFITLVIYRYKQKQNIYFKEIENLKIDHENTLLQSQLEMQEQTFQNISREIHDNIGQKLSLANLHLNTLNYTDAETALGQVNNSIKMISDAINDLTNLSRSMSSEIILNNGLIKGLEFEAMQLHKSGLYAIDLNVTGHPVFMNANTELVLFRIAQEGINNIVKHAQATSISIQLHYDAVLLTMTIIDNGWGFNTGNTSFGTGLQNIKKRAALLKGTLVINSTPQMGTQLKIQIPIYENQSEN